MWQPMPLPYKELPGLSARLLREHHKLYEGYLTRWDGVYHRLAEWTEEDGDAFDYGRLLAEEGFLRNAVRLHEMYFEQLVPGGRGSPEDYFRDVDSMRHVVGALRRAALSSTGWAIFSVDLWRGEEFVFTMKDHITGFPAGAWPLLVLDCYEHAYFRELSKQEYIEAFLKNVDWQVIEARSKEALTMQTHEPGWIPA